MAFLWSALGNNMWEDGDQVAENRLVELYDSDVEEDAGVRIRSQFLKRNGTLRCLISTVAFGMGVSVPDIITVVHWGPPPDILSYW